MNQIEAEDSGVVELDVGGQGGGRNMGNSGGRGRGIGGRRGGRGGSSSFDPLACYRCGVRGHLARDCPSTRTQSLTPSGGNSGPTRGSSFKSGRSGPKRGGKGRHVRFADIKVLYDSEGCAYLIDDYRQVYVPFELEPAGATSGLIEEETPKTTKN